VGEDAPVWFAVDEDTPGSSMAEAAELEGVARLRGHGRVLGRFRESGATHSVTRVLPLTPNFSG
jgi:hypothetical protein